MSLFQIITLLTLVVSLNLTLNPETNKEKVMYPTGKGIKELVKKPQEKLDLSKARPKKIRKPRTEYKNIIEKLKDMSFMKIHNPKLFAEQEQEDQEDFRNNLAIFISIVVYCGFLLYLKIGADAKRRIIP